MAYSYITWAQMRSQLASRFGDSGAVHWQNTAAQPELAILLKEALRTWSAATGYWKTRSSFNTVAGTAFYDLTTAITSSPLAYTVKDQDLVGAMEYHLTEPYSVSSWTGSAMFTLTDLQNALQRRRNQFLLETAMVVTDTQPALPSPPISRVPLSDSVIDVRWLWYADTSSPAVYTQIRRLDEWALNAFRQAWAQTPGIPKSYSVAVTPPLTVQIIAPLASGTLDMISVNAPADLNPALGVLMNIPDDFTWAVKWGALADLMSQDGTARDVLRAEYCLKRYREGVELARMASSVLQCRINDVPVKVISMEDLNNFRQNWRNNTKAKPRYSAMCGFNLMAVADIPDDIYGVTVDVVQNAPMPVLDTDNVQLGREELEAVIGYAQHLGAFKEGGAEFQATLPLYEEFYRLASVYNEKMRANSTFWEVLKDRAIRPIQRKQWRDENAKQAEGVKTV